MKFSNLSYAVLSVFLITTFVSCINEQDKIAIEKSASAFDIKQGEASIKQSNQRFMKSFESADSVEVSNCFTTKGKIMIANTPPIEGRDKIETYMGSLMSAGIKTFELKTIKIWGDSSILSEEGTYEMSDIDNNKVDKGKYIVLWKPESGNWKMFRDTWTSDLPIKVTDTKKKTKKKK